jgi:hypothetical protein
MKLATEKSLPETCLSTGLSEAIRAKAQLRRELKLFVLSDSDDDDDDDEPSPTNNTNGSMWLEATEDSSDRTMEEDAIVEVKSSQHHHPPHLTTCSHHSSCWNESDSDDDDSSSVGSFFDYDDEEDAHYMQSISKRQDCADDADDSSSSRQRSVRFSNVVIREYAVTIGDHPVVGDTCPLSLDWAHSEQDVVKDLTSYEYSRYFLRNLPRRLSLPERRYRVKEVNDLSFEDVEQLETQMKRQQVNESIRYLTPCYLHHTEPRQRSNSIAH